MRHEQDVNVPALRGTVTKVKFRDQYLNLGNRCLVNTRYQVLLEHREYEKLECAGCKWNNCKRQVFSFHTGEPPYCGINVPNVPGTIRAVLI